ncbi:MAG: hypothetical protein H6553_01145 [Chitinophagales bacterium]|nr:hypothetical protein [Chitinophagales bacterium]
MPLFEEHLKQSKNNLQFLEKINKENLSFFDWKVTVCFYTALHIINAHICKKTGVNYKSHEEVDNAINPNKQLSLSKLNESNYLAYKKLQNLSRRSRYLVNESNIRSNDACFTEQRHYKMALQYLQSLINFFENEYDEKLIVIEVLCPGYAESANFITTRT